MSRVLAAISHKGGTGRTTATANVAYRLALSGLDVCCVDLDLTSPTFGAVLGLDHIRVGAERGVWDILAAPELADTAAELTVSVWKGNQRLMPGGALGVGRFDLLPGTDTSAGAPPLGTASEQAEALAALIGRLADDYAMVLLDIRSGTSDIVASLLHAHLTLGAPLDAWLVYFRWTPQHLAGAEDLCRRLDDRPRVITIRTAYEEPDGLPTWYQDQHSDLEQALDDRLEDFKPICSIPFETMLRWKETVIRDRDVEDGIAGAATAAQYKYLAARLARV